ncbi:hypothetical protein PG996_015577 [Apiospora saccharicola]|uniref:Uncharacterized protein n=1 Tax=Apiospora saccharicola TaxID=335842 RepID=A0ABR1TLM5_9PEZI
MRASTIVSAVLGLTTEALAMHPYINQAVEVAPTPTPTHAQAKPRTGPVRGVAWHHPIHQINQTRPAAATAANGTRPEKRKSYDGWCGLHYHIYQTGALFVTKVFVYDPAQKLISSIEIDEREGWHGEFGADVLDHSIYFKVHPFSPDGDQVNFEFGDDHWGTGPPGQKNDRCSVGNWDYGNNPFNHGSWRQLDLDCGFSC